MHGMSCYVILCRLMSCHVVSRQLLHVVDKSHRPLSLILVDDESGYCSLESRIVVKNFFYNR